MSEMPNNLTDHELLYAATGRCRCGAGLAHPLDDELAWKLRRWVCADILKGCATTTEHDALPFALYKVREETSINNRSGATTRPAVTVARTLGTASCPRCQHEWQSEPYDACGLGHHWFSGACPSCGYAVGGAGSHSSTDGPAIITRYRTVVIAR